MAGTFPQWFNVRDRSVLKGFYEGESIFLTAPNIYNWLVPFLVWSAFVFVLYFVLICMNAVLRKQFSEHERLSYPIARLPLEIGKNPEGFFKNRLMWMGFCVAGGIEILNGVRYLYPALPYIPIKPWDNIHLFHDEPWDALGTMLLSFNPFIIGLSFFMPLDLSFSALFFYFLGKALLVGRRVLGSHTGFYLDEQAQGAWIGLGILALWVGRRHLKGVFTQALGKGQMVDDLARTDGVQMGAKGNGRRTHFHRVICVPSRRFSLGGAALFLHLLPDGYRFNKGTRRTRSPAARNHRERSREHNGRCHSVPGQSEHGI